jgi:hypothetical protein
MHCLNDQQLQALADGEGLPAEQAHADSCATCGPRLHDRIALLRSIEETLNPPAGFRQTAALRGIGETTGATRIRGAGLPAQSRRRWIYSAAAIAAALVAVLFVVPSLRRSDATVSAAEILAKSASQLSAVTRGIEVLEYELVLDGVPKEMIPDQTDGTWRIWQAIDHDVPGRFRFASYTPDGRLFSSIAEDPLAKRRVAAFRSEGQPFRFDLTLPPGARNLSLPEMQRLHMEASIAMMQASGNQLVQTEDGANGKFYRIEVPRAAAPSANPVWDLTDARVLIDARDYSVAELAVQGSFLKQPYSLSYKLIRHVTGATLPPDAFTVPAQDGEIVVSGEGTAVPTHDVVVLALRALAQAKQGR